jgi:hypothetical protein
MSLAVFGSVGRGAQKPDSDVGLLLVADSLSVGRLARVEEFTAVERAVQSRLAAAHREGLYPCLSPIFKTVAEATSGAAYSSTCWTMLASWTTAKGSWARCSSDSGGASTDSEPNASGEVAPGIGT